jgi:flavin-dependent dehydrogenase
MSPDMTRVQVLVVGGGPAGSSAAWHCAHAGLDVCVVDRARFPRAKPCAEYVSPEGSRILHAMGALESLEARAAHLTLLRGLGRLNASVSPLRGFICRTVVYWPFVPWVVTHGYYCITAMRC